MIAGSTIDKARAAYERGLGDIQSEEQ
jgi:hypothetical protein